MCPEARFCSASPPSAMWVSSEPTRRSLPSRQPSGWEEIASAWPATSASSIPRRWDAVLTEEPYPVKMLFLTPTAELADIVLPAATWLEMDYIGDFWKRHGWLLPRRKVIQVGECRSDHEMLNDLAPRIGQGEHWWEDFEQGLDWILEPSNLTFQEFLKKGHLRGEVKYRKYEERGFSTPTGKFELYS